MHKLTSLVLAGLLFLSLTSCSFMTKEGRIVLFDLAAEERISNSYFEKIVEAIESKDSEAIKKLFSKKAVNEAEELDNSIEYLFELVQGGNISWKNDRWSSSESSRVNGSLRTIYSWYSLMSNKDTYLFYLVIYDKNSIERENKGLFTLRVIREDDRFIQYGGSVEMEIPGVYWPETAGGPHPLVDNS